MSEVADVDSETLHLNPKRVNSPVWEFFGFPKMDQGELDDTPVCKKCRAKVLFQSC